MNELFKQLHINQEVFVDAITQLAINILLFVFILFFGFWLSKKFSKLITSLLKQRKAEEGLITFLANFTSIISKVITVFIAISQLGVAMTSFVTILGAAGIAFGVAFGGILGNFAGGVLILVTKPFRLSDTISALNTTGEVLEIQMFNTYVKTVDNKITILPNGPLVNGVIINFTREGKRRVDIQIPVAYSGNLPELIQRINALLASHPLVLKEIDTAIYFSEFDAQFGRLNINCWVETEHYLPVHREISNAVYSWIDPIPQIN